jgi:DNA-binding GntR family transcriptional regulator
MEPIVSKPLDELVAKRLREMIHAGDLPAGSRLSETELCRKLGVSRTPVREALRVLHTEGLVEIVPRRGAFVMQPNPEQIHQVFELMAVLEAMCARQAAERMTDEGYRELERLHAELEQAYSRRDHDGYLEANHRFHVRVQELTGNQILNEAASGLRGKALLYRSQQLYQPERFDRSIREHRELLDAFRAKDPEAAEAAMKEHLLEQCRSLLERHGRGSVERADGQ